MTAEPDNDTNSRTVAELKSALAAGTRQAFTALLTEDVRWGGERPGEGNECRTRDQAGDHYMGLLNAGVTLRLADLQPAEPTPRGVHLPSASSDDVAVVTARLDVSSPDPDDFPPEMYVRLTLRGGLIADICILDPPPAIEVLYFDGCPHVDGFVPHLRDLLAEHDITASITLIAIANDDDARTHRFLGSPTVRVNGRDVEPAAAEREHHHDDTGSRAQSPISGGRPYGMQCRLYPTPDGVAGRPRDQWILDLLIDNPAQEAAIAAIRSGDLPVLHQLLTDHPDLATSRLVRHDGRTPLHIATDWPGHYPNVAATITALVAAGADPNARCLGEHPETPLHWAASSDDVDALDALLDAGADINAAGAVIAGGTPMADATAFGQWAAARRLLERGADTNLFEAAALGLVEEVQRHLSIDHPTHERITSSFWGACHGGQIATAAELLRHGADINWVGYDNHTPLDAAHRAKAPALIEWLKDRGAVSAHH